MDGGERTQRSPYEVALGGRIAELHPTLQRYFAAIPRGSIGVGDGVFHRVGTPRRWLRPFLRPMQLRGVVYAGWAQDVPFRIVNRTTAGRAHAQREFLFPGAPWTMIDAVAAAPQGRVVDELGSPRMVSALFDIAVYDGALTLTSRAVGIRLGRRRLRVPGLVAPVVRLTERFDDAQGRQLVDVTIDVPLLGCVYEYGGDFEYRIEKEAP